jgi:type IX secretion system PorP/SprF family membrane protein
VNTGQDENFMNKRLVALRFKFLGVIVWLLSMPFLGSTSLYGQGQDIQFSQFYAITPYQNPAYAGGAHALRGMLHGRYQWPGLDARFVTGVFSVDHYFDKYNSGAGIMIMQDQQGLNDISNTKIDLLYSYELPISKKISVRAGLQGGYGNQVLNGSQLYFASQIDDSGNIPSMGISKIANRKGYFDISSGLLVYSDRIWGGLAFHHINTPSLSFYDGDDKARLPMKYSLTAGYKIPLRSGSHMAYLHNADNISLTPTAHYKAQGKFDQLDFGLYLTYNQLLLGGWYRGLEFIKRYETEDGKRLQNNEAVALSIGWLFYNLSIQYSYDFTVSRLARAGTAGAHELNVTYIHRKANKKRKPMKRLPCPDFYISL